MTNEQVVNDKVTTNGAPDGAPSVVPEWVQASVFEGMLKENVTGYKKTRNFKAYPAMGAGENYATVMLRVEIEVELEDAKTKSMSYMLKIAHDLPMFKEMMDSFNIFKIEQGMYLDIVPEFEKMYRDAGVEVKFGCGSFKLNVPEGTHYVLLEDLRPRGFKNANRLEGLDTDHVKCALIKLAQWHAASATRIETKGMYPEMFVKGFFVEESKEMMQQMNEGMKKPFLQCLKTYQGHESYKDAVEKLYVNFVDLLYKMFKSDPNEFNVLNHGDFWSNNIMYQYDAFNKIKETYLVDYQIPMYNSPAIDLLYFLISSTKFELKLKQFEYFVKFYHDNLVKSLNLLKYPKKLPTLRGIHSALYKYGLWGFNTATGVMGAVLLDPTDKASIDNFLSDSEDGNAFKMLMYSNARYRKHMEAILPWLHNRGALEC